MVVCDTVRQLADWAGRPVEGVFKAIQRGSTDDRNKCKYIRVKIDNFLPIRVTIHFQLKKLNNNIINQTQKRELPDKIKKRVL